MGGRDLRTSRAQHCGSMGEHCEDSSECSSFVQGAQHGGPVEVMTTSMPSTYALLVRVTDLTWKSPFQLW